MTTRNGLSHLAAVTTVQTKTTQSTQVRFNNATEPLTIPSRRDSRSRGGSRRMG
ncbi:hypothetical protein OG413_39000 [Streptomyces sp. NBC_01433]|uniref:hypothetical protein n=1 Tax=Streptomyces sp. NBC_01433 TaxID=2903864 RepID=UPI0022540D26|nr:hypothetical protein [Streptomyces sp. NBC_01433]MCX4681194.1 hypothetical protein [Streptomyces sp. NBC_01433]